MGWNKKPLEQVLQYFARDMKNTRRLELWLHLRLNTGYCIRTVVGDIMAVKYIVKTFNNKLTDIDQRQFKLFVIALQKTFRSEVNGAIVVPMTVLRQFFIFMKKQETSNTKNITLMYRHALIFLNRIGEARNLKINDLWSNTYYSQNGNAHPGVRQTIWIAKNRTYSDPVQTVTVPQRDHKDSIDRFLCPQLLLKELTAVDKIPYKNKAKNENRIFSFSEAKLREYLTEKWKIFRKRIPDNHPNKKQMFTFHSLRASMIVNLLDEGIPAHVTQRQTRHKAAGSTRYYLLKSGFFMASMFDRIDDLQQSLQQQVQTRTTSIKKKNYSPKRR